MIYDSHEGDMGKPAILPPVPPETVVDINTVRGDQDQARRWLRWWFEAAAADVEPETEGISPVVMAWCPHRSERTASGNALSRSRFKPVDHADQLVDALVADGLLDGQWHVYIRCTTMLHEVGDGRRGGAQDTCQLPGLWVDLDAKDGVTEADVVRFVEACRMPARPMVTVSGGGWHVWWRFQTPIFGLTYAAKTLRRWRATVERVAREVAIRADSICSGDPARVMRLAGTWNVKPDRPQAQLCQIVIEPDGDISTEDLDDLLDEAPEQLYNFKPGNLALAGDLPGQQFAAAVPMMAVVEAMGGHDWWTDDNGDTFIMRPDKDRGGHGAVVYADGHAAFYSTSWVGPGTRFPHVKNANSKELACVYNDSFRLLTHAWFGPEDTGFSAARKHVQSLGYGADWDPKVAQRADIERLIHRLGKPAPLVDPTQPLVPEIVERPAYDQIGPAPPAEAVWADGWLEAGEMLEAVGMTPIGKQGSAVAYAWPAADRSGAAVAWVYPGGQVTFQPSIGTVMPAAASAGGLFGWHDLLALFVDVDNFIDGGDYEMARATWGRFVDPKAEGFEGESLWARLRRVVHGVDGVGHANDANRWKFTNALEVSRLPRARPTYLTRDDGALLWYDRKLNIVYGQSESGKTWLCALAALQCVRLLGRRVLWLDAEEPGRAQVAERMKELGATEREMAMVICNGDIIPEMIFTEYGQRRIDHRMVDELVALIKASDIGLVIIDSYGELAGSQDLDDNRRPDLSFLKTRVLAHIIKVAGLVLIDHTGHATGAREAGSKFKRNTTDGTSIFVETVRPFRPHEGGEARLWVMKDRDAAVYAVAKRTEVTMPGDQKPTSHALAAVFKMTAQPGTRMVQLNLVPPQVTDLPSVEGLIARNLDYRGTELLKAVLIDNGGWVDGRDEFHALVMERLPEREHYGKFKFDGFVDRLVNDEHIEVTPSGENARRKVYTIKIGMDGKPWRSPRRN